MCEIYSYIVDCEMKKSDVYNWLDTLKTQCDNSIKMLKLGSRLKFSKR